MSGIKRPDFRGCLTEDLLWEPGCKIPRLKCCQPIVDDGRLAQHVDERFYRLLVVGIFQHVKRPRHQSFRACDGDGAEVGCLVD